MKSWSKGGRVIEGEGKKVEETKRLIWDFGS